MILKLMIVHVGRPEWLTSTGSRFTIVGFYDGDHWPLLTSPLSNNDEVHM